RLYRIDQRKLLLLESNQPLFNDLNFALNDCTILKRDTSSMITIHTYINGSYLNSYWADGLIISTPTGSTGYSLSCGGPIIFPQSGNFVITPVAPHNLNVRPIVISDNSIISFEVEGRANNFLCTLDSRFKPIDSTFQLAVKKCNFVARLVRFTDTGFLNTIREKLVWGVDQRND
ncbi:MAG: NAD(+) kinase, partial [Bacteroidota bacterium]